MPPVSIVSVCAAARMASGMANLMVLLDPALVDDARLEQLEDDDEPEQQDDERDERLVAQQRRDAHRGEQAGAASAGSRLDAAHARRLRSATAAPHEHDGDHDEPFDDLGDVGVDRQEREVLTREAQDEDRPRSARPGRPGRRPGSRRRARRPPRWPAGRAPGRGCRLPVIMVRMSPPMAANRPATAHRRRPCVRSTGTPLRKAASRSEPTAYIQSPRRERLERDPDDPEATTRSRKALGSPLADSLGMTTRPPAGPMMSSRSQRAADPRAHP